MAEERRRSPRRSTRREEQEWEDIDDADGAVEQTTSRPFSTPRTSPRKRRTTTRASYASPAPRRIAAKAKPLPKPNRPLVTEEELQLAFTEGIRSTAKYAWDVGILVFKWLKWPLALFFVVWAIANILNRISGHLKDTFAPLCYLPVISRSTICASTYPIHEQEHWVPLHADYPTMVDIQSKTFEQLLDDNVGSNGLALEIKKAQMATSDLVTLVKVSKLASKDVLATALSDFVDDARQTARGLQRLNAKVSGAVDDILAVNNYALQSIEASSAKQSSTSVMRVIWPFGLTASQNDSKELIDTFSHSLTTLSSSLSRLVLCAQSSLHSLDKLESQLSTIHDILAREDTTITEQHSELLAQLWTRLGGNRGHIRGFEVNLQLLKELGTYRTRALAHVVAALQALETMSADMEELRERVASPELSGGEIPLEVHVRSIRSGIERLSEGRVRAKERELDVERALGLNAS